MPPERSVFQFTAADLLRVGAARDLLDRGPLLRRQVDVPAELLQHLHGELRVAVLDLRADRVDALGQQVLAVPLDAEAGAEAHAALGDRDRYVVEVGRARVVELGRPPARPGQAVVIAVGGTAQRPQRRLVEGVLVGHVELHPLGRLAGIADRPHAAVELARDVLDDGSPFSSRAMLRNIRSAEAELVGEHRHDGVVGQALEQRLDHLLAPLQRAVRRGHRAIGLELRRRRQQVNAVGPVMHDRADGRIGVDDDEEIELLHRLLHLRPARLAVRRVAPEHHRPGVVGLRRCSPWPRARRRSSG